MTRGLIAVVIGLLLATGPAAAIDLPDAISAAEKIDPSLASASNNRDAAFENIAIAKARLRPQIGIQSNVQKLREGISSPALPASELYNVDAYSHQITLRQSLYRRRDWTGVDIGQLQAEYGAFKLASARSDLWLRVTNAWLDVIVAAEQGRIYQETVRLTAVAAEQAEKRFTVGDGTRDVVVEARAQQELAKSQVREAEIRLQSREAIFQLITGLDPSPLRDLNLPDLSKTPLPAGNIEALRELVFDTSTDLLAAQITVQVNKLRAKQAKDDGKPTVDLVASKNWAASDTINTINQRYRTLAVGLQVSVPLFDGGALRAAQRQGNAATHAAEQDLQAAKLKISQQLENDWGAVQSNMERVRSAKVLHASALEQRRATEASLKSGIRTWADVAQAEALIARRRADEVEFTAGALQAEVRLLANLPVTVNIWEPWVVRISEIARRAP